MEQALIVKEIAKTLVKVYNPTSKPYILANKNSLISNFKQVLNVLRKKGSKKKEILWPNTSVSSLLPMNALMNPYNEKYLVLKKRKDRLIERSRKNKTSSTTLLYRVLKKVLHLSTVVVNPNLLNSTMSCLIRRCLHLTLLPKFHHAKPLS